MKFSFMYVRNLNWTVSIAAPYRRIMLSSVLAGFGLGLSLIVAIGAQNVFVLRQGIRREHAMTVATVCALSDAVLIAAGVAGTGALLQQAPWLITAARWAGALFLAGYAVLAARRALRPNGDALAVEADTSSASPGDAEASPRRGTTTRRSIALTCLALTWLNPHVYLDTVFLLGSIAHAQGVNGEGRWWFAGGAVAASVLWFFGLAQGARYLGRWLGSPRAWRFLDAAIAVVMLWIAARLIWEP